MSDVRMITILGLALGILSLMLITIDLRAAAIVGVLGVLLSVRNLREP